MGTVPRLSAPIVHTVLFLLSILSASAQESALAQRSETNSEVIFASAIAGGSGAPVATPRRSHIEETRLRDAPAPIVRRETGVSHETPFSLLETSNQRLEPIEPEPETSLATFGGEIKHGCVACDRPSGKCACVAPLYQHRHSIFAEAIFLRPGGADVIYAIEQTDPDPAVANPTGPVGRTGIDFRTGVRGGFSYAFNDCSSVVASYTWYEGDATDMINANTGNVLHSRIIHPSTLTSGSSSLQASAAQDMNFERADVDFRRLLGGDCDTALNIFGGVRYANLEQKFLAQQTIAVATGLNTTMTDIDFDGFGIGLGLDAERRIPGSGFLFYGKTGASFVAGEFKGEYISTNQFGGGVIGNQLEDFRLISMLDLELGLGWQNDCGNIRFTAGYLASGWFNTLTTDAYIQGFRAGQLEDLSDTLTFSGMTVRGELRF